GVVCGLTASPCTTFHSKSACRVGCSRTSRSGDASIDARPLPISNGVGGERRRGRSPDLPGGSTVGDGRRASVPMIGTLRLGTRRQGAHGFRVAHHRDAPWFRGGTCRKSCKRKYGTRWEPVQFARSCCGSCP